MALWRSRRVSKALMEKAALDFPGETDCADRGGIPSKQKNQPKFRPQVGNPGQEQGTA